MSNEQFNQLKKWADEFERLRKMWRGPWNY